MKHPEAYLKNDKNWVIKWEHVPFRVKKLRGTPIYTYEKKEAVGSLGYQWVNVYTKEPYRILESGIEKRRLTQREAINFIKNL